MHARWTMLLLTTAAALTSTGCYSRWEIAPQMLVRLDGFHANGFSARRTMAVESKDGDIVEFSRDTTLQLRGDDGIVADVQLESIRVQGPHFTAVERETGHAINANLLRLKSVQATNLSKTKSAIFAGGMVAGSAAAIGTIVVILALSGE